MKPCEYSCILAVCESRQLLPVPTLSLQRRLKLDDVKVYEKVDNGSFSPAVLPRNSDIRFVL